jgi:glycogen debranching enzyme
MAEAPIALCEVQGYAYAAWQAGAEIASMLGDRTDSDMMRGRARQLRERFEEAFWLPELGTYALALDGAKRPCRVRASNAGQVLFSGIADPARARRTADLLLSRASFSGWGIRTIAQGEARYNPMSYHNGSVWPHDTAICAAGIALHDRSGALRLLRAVFETATHFEMRLPELFCGFAREHGATPVSYPVACLPQAWAAGAAFMLLQSCLGVQVDGWANEIRIDHPQLPLGIDQVALRGLRVGAHCLDLVFRRIEGRIVAWSEGKDASAVSLQLRNG